MNILPGFSTSEEVSMMSSGQVITYAVEHYILIGLYIFLLFLVMMNFWNIIIQQQKYKSLPLLAFYIFAFIAIFLRLNVLIWYYLTNVITEFFSTV